MTDATDGTDAPGGPERGWRRLDPRMLVVQPVLELRRMVVPVIGVVVFGASQGGGPWVGLVAVAAPVLVGVVRYLTTTYRIADGRVELQRGLLNRNRLSTPLDRVRTVDLTASVVHRALGLSTVTIGTGSAVSEADERLALDALSAEEARALRARLLEVAPATTGQARAPEEAAPPAVAAAFELRWLRYAPFTSAGLVVLGGLVGGAAQLLEAADIRIDITEAELDLSPVVIVGAVLALGVLALALTVLGYLVANWAFTLARVADTWRIGRGLLTTRETSIDVERLAGVAVGEPPGLRLARGARLTAIVTGLDRTQAGSEVLVPPAPADLVRRAGAAVLGSERPLLAPLVTHGRAATRRRWVRALAPAALVAVTAVLLVAAGAPPLLLAAAVVVPVAGLALAADRARSLGHALVDGHLVARSGSLLRKREVLSADHVIGWTFRSTWFQQRASLTTLSATTAGGRGAVRVLDVPDAEAVALADMAVTGLLAPFIRE